MWLYYAPLVTLRLTDSETLTRHSLRAWGGVNLPIICTILRCTY